MIFDSILKNIERHITLSEAEKADFCSLLEVIQVKKKEYLIHQEEICTHEAYINKGCFRTFFVDREEVEHTFYFGIEDWWISDIYSRTFKVPSQYKIMALEDAEVFLISDNALEAFLLRVPKMEYFYRKLFQHSMAVYQLRLLQLHQHTAEERYRNFRQKYPEFDRRIPQKYIASFLGLTPEFFNTVRTRVLKSW
ncbi:Crp/Fnr family transcriptional regulator [Pedobacter lusitanus]|uniref:Crp/Fnr family transcriptional regulator n=1 Tax=Pedobacter lusitanus TaxID=1503925 RepID=A0A0D0GW75_9SPHI|nr:Crp/Fnr family transcriptional regulator [Pedobacter lusitanus]KIO78701.1 Crp/Fnr family transcriptional regulator [Pedobacter lusitanus]